MTDRMDIKKGLDGVIAEETRISMIDPEKNELLYRGYSIEELCEKSNFLEVAYLLLIGELPDQTQLAEFVSFNCNHRQISSSMYRNFKYIPRHTHPMDSLRLGVTGAALFDDQNIYGENSRESNLRKAMLLLAQMPTLIANGYRLVNGKELISPRSDLSHSKNFLYMLLGHDNIADDWIKTFDTALILGAEEGLCASTFSARVTASTLSDFYSAIITALSTLKGPLHGGANEQVMHMLIGISEPALATAYVKDRLDHKEKIMGFGHRLFRAQDPRAVIIKKLGIELAQGIGNSRWYTIANIVEETMKKEKNLSPNIDFALAPIYYLMGIPAELYTPIFAAARMIGWAAHIIEQHDDNRLIRPLSRYVGARKRAYIPISRRGGHTKK